VHLDPAVDVQRTGDLLDEREHRRRASLFRRRGTGASRRQHRLAVATTRAAHSRRRAGRARPPSDLEANRALVESGLPALELAQRRPHFASADVSPGRLDDHIAGHRRARLLLPAHNARLAGGFGGRRRAFRRVGFAVLPLFGRRSRRPVWVVFAASGASRRVTSPWPTVQRIRRHPVEDEARGKFAISGMKTIGRAIMIQRCVLSIVADMKYVDRDLASPRR
jgi:hypothetical protein